MPNVKDETYGRVIYDPYEYKYPLLIEYPNSAGTVNQMKLDLCSFFDGVNNLTRLHDKVIKKYILEYDNIEHLTKLQWKIFETLGTKQYELKHLSSSSQIKKAERAIKNCKLLLELIENNENNPTRKESQPMLNVTGTRSVHLQLHNDSENSHKYYMMEELTGKNAGKFQVSYGRVGNQPQTKIYDMSEFDKLLASKLKKGYTEVKSVTDVVGDVKEVNDCGKSVVIDAEYLNNLANDKKKESKKMAKAKTTGTKGAKKQGSTTKKATGTKVKQTERVLKIGSPRYNTPFKKSTNSGMKEATGHAFEYAGLQLFLDKRATKKDKDVLVYDVTLAHSGIGILLEVDTVKSVRERLLALTDEQLAKAIAVEEEAKLKASEEVEDIDEVEDDDIDDNEDSIEQDARDNAIDGALFYAEPRVHDKTGEDLIIVKFSRKIERDDYLKVKAIMKKHKSYYSIVAGGFVFKKEDEKKAYELIDVLNIGNFREAA